MKPDKNRVKDLLSNWRRWSRDDPPNPAEVYYYTVSPMFRDFVKPTASNFCYDSDSALMVEEVLRLMCGAYSKERQLICDYYLREIPSRELSRVLGLPKSTMYRHLDMAMDAFADHWDLLIKNS